LVAVSQQLREVAAVFDARFVAVSAACVVVQTVLVAATWRSVVRATGERVDLATAYSIIYLAAVGRYLPGRVWALAGVALLAAQAGLSVRATALASTATVALVLVTGVVMAAVGYASSSAGLPLTTTIAAWLAVPLASAALAAALKVGLALTPGRGSARGEPLASKETNKSSPSPAHGRGGQGVRATRPLPPAHRQAPPGHADTCPAPQTPAPASLALAVAWSAASWLPIALGQWAAARALLPLDPAVTPALLASSVVAWAASLAALPVPAGLGVREAVQALAVGGLMPPPIAAAFALLVRVALVAADLVALLIAWWLRPASRIAVADAPLPDH
jgi:uncharacterized membrane protein YbhN (UPF0104 family)